jgi:hypothetical protein
MQLRETNALTTSGPRIDAQRPPASNTERENASDAFKESSGRRYCTGSAKAAAKVSPAPVYVICTNNFMLSSSFIKYQMAKLVSRLSFFFCSASWVSYSYS